MKKFIIDTDGGIDDAQAICMALAAQNIDILAITTVSGNVSAKQAAVNINRLFSAIKTSHIPIFIGCSKSILNKEIYTQQYHGIDGFGDVPPAGDFECKNLIKSEHGVNALLRLAHENQGEITLICLGPLTNISLAVRYSQTFNSNIKEVFIMGGKGNTTVSAEFNFHCDPEAAHIVITSIKCPITLAPWELCLNHSLPWTWYERSRNRSTDSAKFFRLIEQKIVKKCKDLNWPNYVAADELAMASAINEDVITEWRILPAIVELWGENTRGQLVCDWRENHFSKDTLDHPKIRIIVKLNEEIYDKLLFSSLSI